MHCGRLFSPVDVPHNDRDTFERKIMQKALFVVAIVLIACHTASAQPYGVVWKTFENRRGWSISYPSDWRISSCRACSDPTDPDVFAEFTSPSWETVMILPIFEPKAASESIDSWLSNLGKNGPGPDYFFKRILYERWTLNGMPALHERYRDLDQMELDENYILTACGTFKIGFSIIKPGKIQYSPNYHSYLHMLHSFTINCHR